jgi:hypothetical protein
MKRNLNKAFNKLHLSERNAKNFPQFASQIEEEANKLRNLGCRDMTMERQLNQLLSGLKGKKFQTIKAVIDATEVTDYKLAVRLIKENIQRNPSDFGLQSEEEETSSESDIASHVKTAQKKKEKKNNARPFSTLSTSGSDKKKCKKCGKLGHDSKYCKSHIECFNCGKKGHYAAECRGPKREDNADTEANATIEQDNKNEFCFITKERANPKNSWILDSACTSHMTPFKDDLITSDHVHSTVSACGGQKMMALGKGTAPVKVLADGRDHSLLLKNTIHVPRLKQRLMSLPKLDDANFSVLFKNSKCFIRDSTERLVATGTRKGNLFFLDEKKQLFD